MVEEKTIGFQEYLSRAQFSKERTWVIVGFDHPNGKQSLIYKHCKRTETLLRYVEEGIKKGCNLFSIRGVDQIFATLPDPAQSDLIGEDRRADEE